MYHATSEDPTLKLILRKLQLENWVFKGCMIYMVYKFFSLYQIVFISILISTEGEIKLTN